MPTCKQIRQIADSIKQFGFTNPLLIDKANLFLAGHGRLAAAELLGMAMVPSVRLEHMTPAQKRAYGRYRTNVGEYRGVNTLKPGCNEELALHPTVKPSR